MKAATAKADSLSPATGASDVAQLKREISEKYDELRDKAKVIVQTKMYDFSRLKNC